MGENIDRKTFDLPSILNSKELNFKYNIMMHEQQGDQSVLKHTVTEVDSSSPHLNRLSANTSELDFKN